MCFDWTWSWVIKSNTLGWLQLEYILEKLTGYQLVKKFPAFYGHRRLITELTSSLSWARSIQSMAYHPTSCRIILTLYQRNNISTLLLNWKYREYCPGSWFLVTAIPWVWIPKGRFTHSMSCRCCAHAVPLSCRAAKGLECVFPIWFTECGRTWFTLAMPCRGLEKNGMVRVWHGRGMASVN